MAEGRHLALTKVTLRSGTESRFKGRGWGLFRVQNGVCYWRQADVACELSAGHVLLFPDSDSGTILVSRLGPAEGHLFFVDHQMLSGVLTAGECRYLCSTQKAPATKLRCFQPDHDVARRFAALVSLPESRSAEARLQMLDVFISASREELQVAACCVQPAVGARERLRQLVDSLAEAELTRLSLPQIATELRCSHRHASRLFRVSFGQSLRSKQTELRLACARRLLETTNAKVIEVAMESGFQSLGLFNSMFKRTFGMTPSQWRRRVKGRSPEVTA